jgi:hypothetical protein
MKFLDYKMSGRYNYHCATGPDLLGSYMERLLRGLHKIEIVPTEYTETFVSLKSRKVSLYLVILRKKNEKLS